MLQSTRDAMTLELDARFVARFLSASLAMLFTANLAVHGLYLLADHDHQLGLRTLFDMSGEWNVPALYSGALILSNALLLAHIGFRLRDARAKQWESWCILSVIFLYLSIDETVSIHEKIALPTREMFNLSGLLYFGWMLPGMAFALVVFLSFLRFLCRLDRSSRALFLLAGTIFISGAVGFEMLGGWRFEATAGNTGDPIYIAFSACEETLEIAGMSLMFYALVRHASRLFGPARVRLPKGIVILARRRPAHSGA